MTDDDVRQGGHWAEDAKDKKDDERTKLGGSLIQPKTRIRRL